MGIKILDCTLRDGGHVNNGKFGSEQIRDIAEKLSKSNVDIIEMGFLRDGNFTKQQALFNRMEEVYPFLAKNAQQQYSVMIRPDWYDINQLQEDAERIQNIRFAFYYKDRKLTEKYCAYVRKKGYSIFLNPVNIVSYETDEELIELIKFVNWVHPDSMTIVDTFGSLTLDRLEQIYDIVENNLDEGIAIGAHLHDNMLLSVPLMQKFLEISNKKRNLYIDGSLDGMGRMPGNLPIEILADYMNSYLGEKKYEIAPLLSAISQDIYPIKEIFPWGYSPAYYLSGKLKVHRSYSEYYLKKPECGLDEIERMLEMISITEEKWSFDQKYADEIEMKCRGERDE